MKISIFMFWLWRFTTMVIYRIIVFSCDINLKRWYLLLDIANWDPIGNIVTFDIIYNEYLVTSLYKTIIWSVGHVRFQLRSKVPKLYWCISCITYQINIFTWQFAITEIKRTTRHLSVWSIIQGIPMYIETAVGALHHSKIQEDTDNWVVYGPYWYDGWQPMFNIAAVGVILLGQANTLTTNDNSRPGC